MYRRCTTCTDHYDYARVSVLPRRAHKCTHAHTYVHTVHYFRRSVNHINAIASTAGWLAGQRSDDDGGTTRRETGQLEPELCYRGVGPSRESQGAPCPRKRTWVLPRQLGQIRRPTLHAARNVLHYKVQDTLRARSVDASSASPPPSSFSSCPRVRKNQPSFSLPPVPRLPPRRCVGSERENVAKCAQAGRLKKSRDFRRAIKAGRI